MVIQIPLTSLTNHLPSKIAKIHQASARATPYSIEIINSIKAEGFHA
jgi:hypothetical protein